MNDHPLRGTLLNLQSRLSNDDRQRLHFYLTNDVPRTVADDSSLNGTLKLMQSLFDQDKINENDFTFLIDAFQTIQCFDAVRLLKEHQRRMRLSGCSQSTLSLASVMPSLASEVDNDDDDGEEVDKYPTESCRLKPIERNKNRLSRYSSIDIIYDEKSDEHLPMINKNSSETPMRINQKTKAYLPKSKNVSWISSLLKKYSFFPYLLFLLVLTVLLIVVVGKIQRFHSFEKTPQIIDQFNKLMLESNHQQNISTKQWNGLLSEKNAAIDKLNETIIETKKQRDISRIKAGKTFGGGGGDTFDDSVLLNFTSTHYLSGFIISGNNSFDACQFIYRSPYLNQSLILSPIHGNNGHPMSSTHTYHLDDDERVEEVKMVFSNKGYWINGKDNFTTLIVNGFQFKTTTSRIIPADIPLVGSDIKVERFPGHILGYVTGKTGVYIDQLQFMWYQTRK